MIYSSEVNERNAVMSIAELMSAAARTAPMACGVDLVKTMVLDGGDKDGLTPVMREIGAERDKFFIRDAGCVDACHCIVMIGAGVAPRGLNCGLCGMGNCAEAVKGGIPCALSVHDLGIAVGSAAATAMDCRIDNRILYTAGMAALKMKLFPDDIKMCFGVGLATTGKNVFFDRPPVTVC